MYKVYLGWLNGGVEIIISNREYRLLNKCEPKIQERAYIALAKEQAAVSDVSFIDNRKKTVASYFDENAAPDNEQNSYAGRRYGWTINS